jgi:hypothetical protein
MAMEMVVSCNKNNQHTRIHEAGVSGNNNRVHHNSNATTLCSSSVKIENEKKCPEN